MENPPLQHLADMPNLAWLLDTRTFPANDSLRAIALALAELDSPDSHRILQIAVEGVREVLGVDVAYVAVGNDFELGEGRRYRAAESLGISSARYRQKVVLPGQGLGGLVARLQRPLVIDDYVSARTISKEFYDLVVGDEGLRAMACAPIPGPHGADALLYAASRFPHAFADAALTSLETIANMTGIAVHQSLCAARRVHLERVQERERLAIDLHDSVAQVLFGIRVEAARDKNLADPDEAVAALKRIQALAATASSDLRSTLEKIAEIPDTLAVESVIEAEARAFEKRTGATVTVVRRGGQKLSELHESLICDVVREGLRNAAKHARAQEIGIHLCYEQEFVRVAIHTDPPTASATATPDRTADVAPEPADAPHDGSQCGAGCGLSLLRKVAERLDGSLTLEVGEPGESALTLELPLGRGSDEAVDR